MAKFKVEQVRDPSVHPQLGARGKVVKSKTVDERDVSDTRAKFRDGMRGSKTASSDSIRVTRK